MMSEEEQKCFFFLSPGQLWEEARLLPGSAPAHASAAEGRGEERTALPGETSFSVSVPGCPFRISQ